MKGLSYFLVHVFLWYRQKDIKQILEKSFVKDISPFVSSKSKGKCLK